MKFSHAYQYLLRLMLLVVVLLIIFSTRLTLATNGFFGSDEVRLINRAEGNFAQVIAWQPTDWPPLYNLVVSAWMHTVSNHPMLLRWVSVFLAMFGIAATYRLGVHLWGSYWSGLVSAVALVALKYYAELSIFVRGYIMGLSLFPLTLWLTLRYFERPSWRRALVLAVAISVMFYTTYISMFAFAIIGLITLVRYGRSIWLWWLPILLSFLLVLPELLYKYSRLSQRFATNEEANIQQAQSLWVGIENVAAAVFGTPISIWIGLLMLTGIVLLWKRQGILAWVLLAIALAAPFIIYGFVEARLIFYFHHRYLWWMLELLALFVGAGVAQVPRKISLVYIAVLFGLMSFGIRDFLTRSDFDDYETYFPMIADEFVTGDVLVRDTNFCRAACGHGSMAWEYYEQYYFGNTIPVVAEPEAARRVWYVRAGNREDDNLESRIREGRIPAHFFGPSRFFTQLFIAPPNPEGILFENGMRFHGIDFLDEQGNLQANQAEVNEQSRLWVRLWWSIDEPLAQDYSVSVQLYTEAGQRLAQQDGAPSPIHLQPLLSEPLPQSMTAWEPRKLYVEDRWLEIPDLDTFHYGQVFIVVYDWRDNTRFYADGVNEDGLLPIQQQILTLGW